MIKCPICKKTYLKVAIKKHIIQMAQREGFLYLNTMLNYAKNKPYKFSPIVLLGQSSHLKFWRKHLKNQLKFEL